VSMRIYRVQIVSRDGGAIAKGRQFAPASRCPPEKEQHSAAPTPQNATMKHRSCSLLNHETKSYRRGKRYLRRYGC